MRVALVGLGAMGRNHMRVLESMPDVNLVSVFDAKMEQKIGNGIQAKSLSEIIDLKPDYCVVATPTNTHEEIVAQLSKNKINLLIEKPISYSFESALRMRNEIIENQVIATVGHVERFNSALIEAKRRIQLGQIGRIFQITTRRLSPLPPRVTDVGVILDLASHDIDLTKWLVDSSYYRVSGFLNRRPDKFHEDVLIASALLKDGIIVSHIVNWLSPFKERVTVITGEKGTFVINTLNSELIFYSFGEFDVLQSHIAHFKGGKESEVTNYAFEKPEPLLVEHREFMKAIRGETSLTVTIQDSLETIRVAEALFLSDKTGNTIEL
jgi:UDP-N-acetylglucosamine 3-dehydrogenase